jgi:signal transduction histidine kinase
MHRAILNVITNAIDACQDCDEKLVNVATIYDPKERMARVRVNDSGTGIEKDDLERIFSVFVSRKGGRGTGLGLPVSQKILQEHGGRIRVESQAGQGSCFTLEFPATTPLTNTTENHIDEMRDDANVESISVDHVVADHGHSSAGTP